MIPCPKRVLGGVFAIAASLPRFGLASEVCTPGHSSPAALRAEENRALGERHLEAARAQPLDSLRDVELSKAEERFRSAVEGSPCIVPLHLLRLAETLTLERRYLEARAVFQQIGAHRSELAKYRIYAEPLRRADESNAALDAKIASIRVIVHASACSEPIVRIDGSTVESEPILHDPGTLKIEVSARGCFSQSAFHKLHDGANDRFEVTLIPLTPPQGHSDDSRSWLTSPTLGVPRWVWVSVGGALVVAGGYASYRALSSNQQGESASFPAGSWGTAPVR